jgi:hypothetical protein
MNHTDHIGSSSNVSDISILEVIGSNLNGTLIILTEDFCIFLSPSSQVLAQNLILDQDHFVPHPFQ